MATATYFTTDTLFLLQNFPDTEFNQGAPSVGTTTTGGVISWDTATTNDLADLAGFSWANSSLLRTEQYQINLITPSAQRDSEVSGLTSGNSVVVWTDFSFTGQARIVRGWP